MEQDCGSWCPPQQLNPIMPRISSMFVPAFFKHQNTVSASEKSYANMISASGVSSFYAQPVYSPGMYGNEPHGCFSFPCSQQQFTPAHTPVSKELDGGSSIGNHVESSVPKTVSEYSQKRFFVFDHSGDQTTLIFSSGTGKPLPFLPSWNSNLPATYGANQHMLKTKVDLIHDQEIIPGIDFDMRNQAETESEMHEDTEELNALLYSDSENDYYEEEEVTSSGHLPDIVSAHENPEASVGSTEGIGSIFGHIKKRKIDDGRKEEPPSHQRKIYLKDENDAESCANDGYCSDSLEFVPDNKRIKKEKIFEMVSLLRSIVPDGEKENPVIVLDKAIDYLRSLKLKAKSLGLNDL